MLLTAITGSVVTIGQLMGDDEPDAVAEKKRLSEGERRMRKILRAHEKRQKKE